MIEELKALPIVQKKTSELKKKIKNSGLVGAPKLVVFLIGDNPSSLRYIEKKKEKCLEIGANFELRQFNDSVGQEEVFKAIEVANQDSSIDACLFQLPVPARFKKLKFEQAIAAHKDADGLHPSNLASLFSGSLEENQLLPCTPKGIFTLLDAYNLNVESKNCLVIGRSLIVGRPLAQLLLNKNATVIQAHSYTKELKYFSKQAEFIFLCTGQAEFFDQTYFSLDKNQVIIDVGTSVMNGKLKGDSGPRGRSIFYKVKIYSCPGWSWTDDCYFTNGKSFNMR